MSKALHTGGGEGQPAVATPVEQVDQCETADVAEKGSFY